MNAAEQCLQWRPFEQHPTDNKPFSIIHLIYDQDSILFPLLQQNTFVKSFHYRSLSQSGTFHIIVGAIISRVILKALSIIILFFDWIVLFVNKNEFLVAHVISNSIFSLYRAVSCKVVQYNEYACLITSNAKIIYESSHYIHCDYISYTIVLLVT